MSKNDIDVGIVFQKEELKELIIAIECAITCVRVNMREDLAMKLSAHSDVLREVLDNETN